MKAFMMTDMEGVAGVVSFESQSYGDGRYYDAGKKLVTAEVNAAADGLFDAGIEDVLVCDGHGPGAIVFEDLHPRAKLLHGRPITKWQLIGRVKDYDFSIMVGQHAMAGVADGNQNHTFNSQTIDRMTLNGQEIGETAVFALYQGAFGVPMIFLSGDQAACREAHELIPGVTTVAVKEGVGRNCAISLSGPEARARIREGVRQAIEKHRTKPVAPLKWPGPYVLERRFFHTDVADGYEANFGGERIDAQTVRFRGDDITDVIYR